jgi:hypothetical protein
MNSLRRRLLAQLVPTPPTVAALSAGCVAGQLDCIGTRFYGVFQAVLSETSLAIGKAILLWKSKQGTGKLTAY